MHWVYILQSEKDSSFYKGETNDLVNRFKRHNAGFEDYTSKLRPWRLVWFAHKATKAEGKSLERKLKNMSRAKLLTFISKYPINGHVTGLDVKGLLPFSRDAD